MYLPSLSLRQTLWARFLCQARGVLRPSGGRVCWGQHYPTWRDNRRAVALKTPCHLSFAVWFLQCVYRSGKHTDWGPDHTDQRGILPWNAWNDPWR